MSKVTTWGSDVCQLLSMCHVHIEIRINFSVLERLLPYFLRFFVCVPAVVTLMMRHFAFEVCLCCPKNKQYFGKEH